MKVGVRVYQFPRRQMSFSRFKGEGWKRVKWELTVISPRIEAALKRGVRTPEGWGRFKDGRLKEAVYVEYDTVAKRWNVVRWPQEEVLMVAPTKVEALKAARQEAESLAHLT